MDPVVITPSVASVSPAQEGALFEPVAGQRWWQFQALLVCCC